MIMITVMTILMVIMTTVIMKLIMMQLIITIVIILTGHPIAIDTSSTRGGAEPPGREARRRRRARRAGLGGPPRHVGDLFVGIHALVIFAGLKPLYAKVDQGQRQSASNVDAATYNCPEMLYTLSVSSQRCLPSLKLKVPP
jgi:hypothetical protein